MGRLIDEIRDQCLIGNTPIEDISELIPDYLLNLKDLNEVEFKNITKATLKYLSGNKSLDMKLDYLYGVHKDMFCDVWRWAGKKRKVNLNIGCDKHIIDELLLNLIKDINYLENSHADAIEVSAIFHHRLVKIHPFINGNGRWARLVVNCYLKSKTDSIIKWPENNLNQQNEFRKSYITALKIAGNGVLTNLIRIHRDLINDDS